MKVLVLFKDGERTFIRGFTSAIEGIPCPGWLTGPWVDQYKNLKWELLEEFLPEVRIVAANLAPTAQQLTDAQDKAFVDRVAPIFFKLLKQAIKTTSTPAESWKTLDAAIRAQMNGG